MKQGDAHSVAQVVLLMPIIVYVISKGEEERAASCGMGRSAAEMRTPMPRLTEVYWASAVAWCPSGPRSWEALQYSSHAWDNLNMAQATKLNTRSILLLLQRYTSVRLCTAKSLSDWLWCIVIYHYPKRATRRCMLGVSFVSQPLIIAERLPRLRSKKLYGWALELELSLQRWCIENALIMYTSSFMC